ncbi:uncharacterized protein LOC125946318 [Dermacentor silvarum]|uniref:uncharacterized protein LOC125946318 n=1 Tax=Dermacentor silvarum TaxID=543639 RepID=UPI002100903B|nr:uncharacterized protein LOC125946318 [Dermacentor silvarum]
MSLGSPVNSTVFPRVLEERSDGGEVLVAIRAGQTLTLRKASVLRKELEVTTFDQEKEVIHYMNGTRMEQDLYHDSQARAAVILTRSRGLRLVGILSPTERIQPSASRRFRLEGLVKHDIIPIVLNHSDVDMTSDVTLQDPGVDSNTPSSDTPEGVGSTVQNARPGENIYPIKAICETRILVDSTYFDAFGRNKERLVKYFAVHIAFANLKFRTFQDDILQMQLSVTGIAILSLRNGFGITAPGIENSDRIHPGDLLAVPRVHIYWDLLEGHEAPNPLPCLAGLYNMSSDLVGESRRPVPSRKDSVTSKASWSACSTAASEPPGHQIKEQEKFIERYEKDHSIMLRSTLHNLNLFVQNQSLFKDDDVVVLFTGLDMGQTYGNPRSVSTEILGLAKLGGVCGSNKAAIVEDIPRTFSSVHTLAHEIGHL